MKDKRYCVNVALPAGYKAAVEEARRKSGHRSARSWATEIILRKLEEAARAKKHQASR